VDDLRNFLFLQFQGYITQRVSMNWVCNLCSGTIETHKPTELSTKFRFFCSGQLKVVYEVLKLILLTY
jgi:hypothetical protein